MFHLTDLKTCLMVHLMGWLLRVYGGIWEHIETYGSVGGGMGVKKAYWSGIKAALKCNLHLTIKFA